MKNGRSGMFIAKGLPIYFSIADLEPRLIMVCVIRLQMMKLFLSFF